MAIKSTYLKAFDTITKVSEYLKAIKTLETNFKYKDLDCGMFPVASETMGAWRFDMGERHDFLSKYRYVYAPKSRCKLLENDHYINEDGSRCTEKFVLVPRWIMRKW